MTDDELANAFAANLAELHAKIGALEDGSRKTRLARNADIAHRALENIQEVALDGGMIAPMSGGTPK